MRCDWSWVAVVGLPDAGVGSIAGIGSARGIVHGASRMQVLSSITSVVLGGQEQVMTCTAV